MSVSGFRKMTCLVLAVALAVRIGWALLVPVVPLSDSFAYDTMARMLAEHGVYGWTPEHPSAFWPVGTSALYAGLYALFGHNFIPVVLLNICFGVAVTGLTIWLGRTFFDERTALVAGILMALWPSEVAFVTILASELPFTFFVLLGCAAWFASIRSYALRTLSCGLMFGAACYFRPTALLIPVALWISIIPQWQRLREQFPALLLTMLIVGLTIAPWSLRNTRVFGHFVLLSTNGGVVLWMGNNPETTGSYMRMPAWTRDLSEYDRDKILGERAVQYILQEPGSFLLRSLKKAALLHAGETIAVHWNSEGIKQRFDESLLLPLKLLTQVYWSCALLLAGIGFVLLARESGFVLALFHPAVLMWVYFTVFYATTLIQDRYHFPCHPFIAMLAATTLVATTRRKHHSPATAVP